MHPFVLFLYLVGCSTLPDTLVDNRYREGYNGIKSSEKVLIVPISMEYRELSEDRERVTQSLKSRFEENGMSVSVLNEEIYWNVWGEVLKEVGGIYSPINGLIDKTKYENALTKFISKTSRSEDFSVVIFPALIIKKAKTSGGSARWDGVKRRVLTKGVLLKGASFSGNVEGLSLQVMVLDSSANWLSTTYGGLVLPYYEKLDNLRVPSKELKQNLFSNDLHINEGVDIALSPLFSPVNFP
ncbi:MAG: hypothetical protein COA99_15275 [Moraxellaceae bacterium]|nr:MAG: hypothetical protein COA99_15275 [Moraxellaceae bacterium]